jgi:hypothetical protein
MAVVINNDMSALLVENYQMLRIVVSTAVVWRHGNTSWWLLDAGDDDVGWEIMVLNWSKARQSYATNLQGRDILRMSHSDWRGNGANHMTDVGRTVVVTNEGVN